MMKSTRSSRLWRSLSLATPALLGAISGRVSAQIGLIWSVEGDAACDELGDPVAVAGDLNGDGSPDLIAGARGHSGPAGDHSGQVIAFSGVDGARLWAVDGEGAGDEFGSSVSAAGDVNGDGFADVLVGAPLHDGPSGAESGRFYLLSGLTGEILFARNGEAYQDHLGSAVSPTGDADGDGVADFAVSAELNDTGGLDRGKVYCISGRTLSLRLTLTGEIDGGRFGTAISDAGDVDGDAVDDLAVAANFADATNGAQCGRVYLFSGATGLALWSHDGEQPGDRLGTAVAGAGDVDRDGWLDVVAGAQQHDRLGAIDAGKAYVFSGRTGAVIWAFDGEHGDDRFGKSVAAAGDFDRDGFADVAVGAPYYEEEDGAPAGGQLLVFSGRTGKVMQEWEGEEFREHFGESVSILGDVTGDGLAEIAVGGHLHEDVAAPERGKIYVLSPLPLAARRL